MGKRTVIIVSFLTATVVFFVALDLLINTERYRLLNATNENTNFSSVINVNAVVVQTNQNVAGPGNENVNSATENAYILTTDLLEQAGFTNTKIEDVKTGVDLFGVRLDSLPGTITKRYMYQGDFPIGMVYEIDPTLKYDQVRTILSDRIAASPGWRLNEANDFGLKSLYINNVNRSTTTFILISFNTITLGFEYPKDKHSLFQQLFKNLFLTF